MEGRLCGVQENRTGPTPSLHCRSNARYCVGVAAASFSAATRSDASFNSRESFSTRWRMILPALNFTVARGGITKLLPGSFGLRPTRGLVRRG